MIAGDQEADDADELSGTPERSYFWTTVYYGFGGEPVFEAH